MAGRGPSHQPIAVLIEQMWRRFNGNGVIVAGRVDHTLDLSQT